MSFFTNRSFTSKTFSIKVVAIYILHLSIPKKFLGVKYIRRNVKKIQKYCLLFGKMKRLRIKQVVIKLCLLPKKVFGGRKKFTFLSPISITLIHTSFPPRTKL